MGNAASQDEDAHGMKNGQEEEVDIFNPYVCHRDDAETARTWRKLT